MALVELGGHGGHRPAGRFDPPLGMMPVLCLCAPGALRIDASYQRGMEEPVSQNLIARIARGWNWDLCQPLTVSRRANGHLYVIDGQHRLAAARRRGDIAELPCVVVNYADAAAEAASFVAINQQRKALSKLDLFRAAVASGQPRALAISRALAKAGLSIAPHSNFTCWKPGAVLFIGGIERAWERNGEAIAVAALNALAAAFAGQVLRYGGTLYRGAARICSDEMKGGLPFAPERFARLVSLLGARSQAEWIKAEQRFFAEGDVLFRGQAIEELLRAEWQGGSALALAHNPSPGAAQQRARGEPVLEAKRPGFGLGPSDYKGDDEWAWCGQCDARRSRAQAGACISRFCQLRGAA